MMMKLEITEIALPLQIMGGHPPPTTTYIGRASAPPPPAPPVPTPLIVRLVQFESQGNAQRPSVE